MRVGSIWKYPVKSMIGVEVDTAELLEAGMVGDRAWAVRDEERGGIRGAKKIGELMRLTARPLDGGQVEIGLPDGAVVRSDDPGVDAALSAALAHRVSLWPLQPASDLDHYRRGPGDSDDPMVELRSIFGRDEDEPLPDFSVFPAELVEFESPPGTYLDAFPILVMSTSALASLQAALPDSVVDVRRFRPNLVIDTGDEAGHPEFGWSGRTVEVGEARLRILAPCPRCVMVTREVTPAIPADRAVLRHVVRDLGQNVGVYATVEQPGTVRTGDAWRLG